MKTIIVLISDTSSGLETKVNIYLKEYEKYNVKLINYSSIRKDNTIEYSGMIERNTEVIDTNLISKVSDNKNNKNTNNNKNNK